MSDLSIAKTMPTEKAPAAPKPQPDVMDGVKQAGGVGGKKKPSEIIRDYLMRQTNDQAEVEKAIAVIGQQVQQKVARMIQFGNTVFWAKQAGPGVIDVHIFTEENPTILTKRLKQAYAWAKQHGFRKVTSTITDGRFTGLVKAAGIPFITKQTTVNDGHKMVPAYQVEMDVK